MFFFDRAFRSFFLGGSVFAALAMLVWWLNYPIQTAALSGIDPMLWHAHEMVFGYALATVTGFLLTAVMNWTGANSASGKWLAALWGLWLAARLGYLFNLPLAWVALFDLGFSLGLLLHFFIPVYRSQQWKQLGLTSKFVLLLAANTLFYAGAFGWLSQGMFWGVTAGLFLVLAINLTMMRRLIPFFTEKALGLPEIPSAQWLDKAAIVGFLGLMIVAVFLPTHWLLSVIALPLVVVHATRWWRWYHPRIWRVALLWPLHLSYGFMIVGMALYGLVGLKMVNPSLAIHALAAGGIGLLCSSIMARISLGHTNRNVFEPPKGLILVFILLAITAVVRVLMPMLDPVHTLLWMQISQWGWICAFLLLSIFYWPILTQRSPKNTSGIRL